MNLSSETSALSSIVDNFFSGAGVLLTDYAGCSQREVKVHRVLLSFKISSGRKTFAYQLREERTHGSRLPYQKYGHDKLLHILFNKKVRNLLL